jgi:hypothetical protein
MNRGAPFRWQIDRVDDVLDGEWDARKWPAPAPLINVASRRQGLIRIQMFERTDS